MYTHKYLYTHRLIEIGTCKSWNFNVTFLKASLIWPVVFHEMFSELV